MCVKKAAHVESTVRQESYMYSSTRQEKPHTSYCNSAEIVELCSISSGYTKCS